MLKRARGLRTSWAKRATNYEEALHVCERVAREEHRISQRVLSETRDLIDGLRRSLEEASRKQTSFGQASEDAKTQIEKIERELASFASESVEEFQRALDKKVRRLSKFTVTLFGRTMAGKSTIREAITQGDGSTIGRGAQRTTRDIREYEWDKLRIIDTPGIGAYEGEADKALAMSIIDESDLLLFLISSDGIQETVFQAMKAIHRRNKPVIFVLNVKLDLEHPVYKRRFLCNPERFLGEEAIRGHKERLEKLAQEELGMSHITVIPIHAQAAFLATKEKDQEMAEQLRKASRMDDLLDALKNEVLHYGAVRRLQTFLDGSISRLMDLKELLLKQAKELEKGAIYLRNKFKELDGWLDSYIGTVNQRIEGEVKILFAPLLRRVSSFVDENIERSDVSELWRKEVEAIGIKDWSEKIQQQLLDEISCKLKNFCREIEVDYELIFPLNLEGPDQYDPWDMKRMLKWGSVIAMGLALLLEGWPLVAGGFFLRLFSWFFDDKETKLRRQKEKMAQQLRRQIERKERDVANQVKKWFYKNITAGLVKGIRRDIRAFYNAMFSMAQELRSEARTLDKQIEALNQRLIVRVGQFVSPEQKIEGHIERVVRSPGLKTKILWKGKEPSPVFHKAVGRAIGEWVDVITYRGNTEELVARALVPARVASSMVSIRDGQATVVVLKEMMGLVVGEKGHNVRLASELLGLKIKIQAGGSHD